jgi:hypothetical protein
MQTQPLPVIGTEPHFYGYITGLGIESCPNLSDAPVPSTLYATFEYGSETTVWVVPDHKLFAMLAEHLKSMAFERDTSDAYGISKLWISRRDGRWIVDLP